MKVRDEAIMQVPNVCALIDIGFLAYNTLNCTSTYYHTIDFINTL